MIKEELGAPCARDSASRTAGQGRRGGKHTTGRRMRDYFGGREVDASIKNITVDKGASRLGEVCSENLIPIK